MLRHTSAQCRDGLLSREEGVYGFDYSIRCLRGPSTAFGLAGLQEFDVTQISVLKLSKQHPLCDRLCISVVFKTCASKELCNNYLRTQEDAPITRGWQDISRRDTWDIIGCYKNDIRAVIRHNNTLRNSTWNIIDVSFMISEEFFTSFFLIPDSGAFSVFCTAIWNVRAFFLRILQNIIVVRWTRDDLGDISHTMKKMKI